MKILVDTNVFVASMKFAGVKRKVIWKILEKGYVLVLTDFIIEELKRKFTELYGPGEVQAALENLLTFLGSGLVEVKNLKEYARNIPVAKTLIREKDAPILATVMLDDIDYLVTRDKGDFLENEAVRESEWGGKILDIQGMLALL